MTPNQAKALQALLTQPTKADAARAAGISGRTLRTYLSDPGFMREYEAAFSRLVEDATRQAQQALNPAISTLHEICTNREESSSARISAARSLLEYGLRFTEITDIMRTLEAAERATNVL